METGLIAAIAALVAKLIPEGWARRRNLRLSIQSEIHAVCITMNFALMTTLIDGADDREIRRRYFPSPVRLKSVDRLLHEKQIDAIVEQLPNWQRLEWLSGALGALTLKSDLPPAFRMIEIFGALTTPPLSRYASRETRRFARGILSRPEVENYRTEFYRRQAKK
ncbi:MAG: hypothetical protein ABI995_02705 [Acidobacteriota bacterium]